MRILGLLVMKDEANRYLKDCLAHHTAIFDETFVYDDRSTDESVEIAKGFGCRVKVRPRSSPSFLEHEGKFRQAAWDYLSKRAGADDWVFVFDADEFLVGTGNPSRIGLERLAIEAQRQEKTGVVLHIAEVFGVLPGGRPLVRVDGFWDSITGLRFVRFTDAPLDQRVMGGAPVPEIPTAQVLGRLGRADMVAILHYGYTAMEDRYVKYERYTSKGNHGHNPRHIESILKEPSTITWRGMVPKVAGRWHE